MSNPFKPSASGFLPKDLLENVYITACWTILNKNRTQNVPTLRRIRLLDWGFGKEASRLSNIGRCCMKTDTKHVPEYDHTQCPGDGVIRLHPVSVTVVVVLF